jgi:hypothetical protein
MPYSTGPFPDGWCRRPKSLGGIHALWSTVRTARGACSRPHLASVLQGGRKSANIHVKPSPIGWGSCRSPL